jgi:hypothetical protein
MWLTLTLLAGAIWLNYATETAPEGPFIRARLDPSRARSSGSIVPRSATDTAGERSLQSEHPSGRNN